MKIKRKIASKLHQRKSFPFMMKRHWLAAESKMLILKSVLVKRSKPRKINLKSLILKAKSRKSCSRWFLKLIKLKNNTLILKKILKNQLRIILKIAALWVLLRMKNWLIHNLNCLLYKTANKWDSGKHKV